MSHMKAPFIHFYSTIFNKQKALSDTAEFPRKPIYKGQLKTGGQGKQTLKTEANLFPAAPTDTQENNTQLCLVGAPLGRK